MATCLTVSFRAHPRSHRTQPPRREFRTRGSTDFSLDFACSRIKKNFPLWEPPNPKSVLRLPVSTERGEAQGCQNGLASPRPLGPSNPQPLARIPGFSRLFPGKKLFLWKKTCRTPQPSAPRILGSLAPRRKNSTYCRALNCSVYPSTPWLLEPLSPRFCATLCAPLCAPKPPPRAPKPRFCAHLRPQQ